MSDVTKPLLTDETGKAIAEALTQREMTQTRIAQIDAAAQQAVESAKAGIQAKADEQAARIPRVLDHEARIGLLEGTRGYATPEMFGAAGDGVTDDTQAVQDAIDSGCNVLLTGKYKIDEVKLTSFVTITGSPGGRIVDGKICMCPYSSVVGVTFEVTVDTPHNCLLDIGTYDVTGMTVSGGDDRYTVKDIKVMTDYSLKSDLDFLYVHVGDGKPNLFGIHVSNVSVNGRLGKMFHFKAFLGEKDTGAALESVFVNTVTIQDVWGGVPEYLLYIDYDDPLNLKEQVDMSVGVAVHMERVTGEFSAYAKNDMYIGFPANISAKEVYFIDKSDHGRDTADAAIFYVEKQPWYNGKNTRIRTDYNGKNFYMSMKLADQNTLYANGSYQVDENAMHTIFEHYENGEAFGLRAYRTSDAPAEIKETTLNLVRDTDDTKFLMGVGLKDRMVLRSCQEDGGQRLSLYLRSRPAIAYNDNVGCLYSDLYMPCAVSKAQLGNSYVPVVGSMVFHTGRKKPMWYTGETWVYADGTDANFT